jgi:hypothetical protein
VEAYASRLDGQAARAVRRRPGLCSLT